MQPKLEINHIVKKYGNITALRDTNLVLTPGIYGLLGPNGAGKSTLMKILTQTIESDKGDVFYAGQDIRKMGSAYRELIGYMPQQQGMYEFFSAKNFLRYMAALKGIPKKPAETEILQALKLVHLEDVADQKLGTFSGGMKQRILIAQAILGNPKILIFDEPTAGLDPKERIRIRNMISQIAMDHIVIIATHVVSDVEFIAKEIVLLKKGVVLGSRSPALWLKQLEGHVFEIEVQEAELEEIEKQYLVCNIRRDEHDRIWVRTILEDTKTDRENRIAAPTLEDLYLFLFQEDGEIDAL